MSPASAGDSFAQVGAISDSRFTCGQGHDRLPLGPPRFWPAKTLRVWASMRTNYRFDAANSMRTRPGITALKAAQFVSTKRLRWSTIKLGERLL